MAQSKAAPPERHLRTEERAPQEFATDRVCPECLRRTLGERGSVSGSGPHATESFARLIHHLALEGRLL